jgi:hypothetical protein
MGVQRFKQSEDVLIGSVVTLTVYYDNSFKPLDLWIHVVPSTELTITSSMVK